MFSIFGYAFVYQPIHEIMPDSVSIVLSDEFLRHHTGFGHPESPRRFSTSKEALASAGLLTTHNCFTPREASDDEILLCHTRNYLELVKKEVPLSNQKGSTLLSTGDAPICPQSYHVARLAVGSVLTAIDLLFERNHKTAFCLLRPPGHHACSSIGMGFCIFNNIAIGARYAQKKFNVRKVAIIDWDVHHGNGTQEIFHNDSSVFYFSTHMNGIYPFTGGANERGVNNILNVPISGGNASWSNVEKAFREQLEPAMDHFKPDLLLISAGFDAHRQDPLGGLFTRGGFNLTADNYETLTEIVTSIAKRHCKGRIVSALEGGYDLAALSESVVSHVRALSH